MREEAAATIEHDRFARQDQVPVAARDACAEHGVEQETARGGECKATLVAVPRPRAAGGPCDRPVQVAALAPESLRPEIIRHARGRKQLQPRIDCAAVAGQLAKRQFESICAVRTWPQLAAVASRVNHAIALARPGQAILRGDYRRERHRVGLLRDRVPVLVAAVADVAHCDARMSRELSRDPPGVRTALFHLQQHVRPGAVGFEPEHFGDAEILGQRAQASSRGRRAVRARHAPQSGVAGHRPRRCDSSRANSTVAWQASPSASDRTESLGRRGLDVDAVRLDAEILRDVLRHLRAVRAESRRLREHGEVRVDETPAVLVQQARAVPDELPAVGTLPARVAVGKMLADVAEAERPEQRVAQRVQRDVAIGMRAHPAHVRNAHAAQHHVIAGLESVHVVAGTHPHVA